VMTQENIDASIAALEPAPDGETLKQIAVRAMHWLLGTIEDEHSEIVVTRLLYARAIDGDMPSESEWRANIDDHAHARARALDLDDARALDVARAVKALLGSRLAPIQRLDCVVLAAIEQNGNKLNMGAYHRCETTHCRAGWAITLHPLGAELEAALGPWLAGAVIYLSSTGRVPDFFADNHEALVDIHECARLQA
jgi:hypothetical protein